MAIRPIRLLGDPILRTDCKQVRFPLTQAERDLITDLHDTLRDFRKQRGFGRGIAAPQVGNSKRVIYINSIGALINPRIVKKSKTTFVVWDDCFSFPDLLVKVRRHRSIIVKYRDVNGVSRQISLKNDMSELLQHEIDHINGKLAIDRAEDSTNIVMRSEYMKFFKKRE